MSSVFMAIQFALEDFKDSIVLMSPMGFHYKVSKVREGEESNPRERSKLIVEFIPTEVGNAEIQGMGTDGVRPAGPKPQR